MPDFEIPRADALPENAHYSDDGCPDGLITSCLRCPLPVCRYESAGGISYARRVARNRALAARHQAGAHIDELAGAFAVSRRTVFRILEGGVK